MKLEAFRNFLLSIASGPFLWLILIFQSFDLADGITCYKGQASVNYPPKRMLRCPSDAQFCYKSSMPHHFNKYEWGCARPLGCMKVGCEAIKSTLMDDRMTVCCCNHNLCNSAPPARPPRLPLVATGLLCLLPLPWRWLST